MGKIRIISGKWRGRKISTSKNPQLRPTPDRVRETLFNWLQPVIEGANCLDLFAGSGILGFEALSRGAAQVTMVEQHRGSVDVIELQARGLQARNLNIVCDDAAKYLANSSQKFDIVFLDPPFSENLLQTTCESLLNKGHLKTDAFVYVESDKEIVASAAYSIYRQSKAGNVNFVLLRLSPGRKEQA